MTKTAPPLAGRIEQAIDATLRALIERAPPEQRAEHVVTAVEIDEADVNEADLAAIIADPIGSALRSEIASLGSYLFDTLGTTDEIDEVADRIAGLDDANRARRAAILDECWADVGFEDDAD